MKEPPRGRRPRPQPDEERVVGIIPEGPRDVTPDRRPAPDPPGRGTRPPPALPGRQPPPPPVLPAPPDRQPPAPPAPSAPPRPTRVPAAPAREPAEPAPTADEALTLPPGALLAARKSGGLLFSSREIVVYPDGRVTGAAVGGGRSSRAAVPRTLSPAQLAALQRTLAALDLGRLPAPPARQRPDAFVYEIAVRVGSLSRAIEVAEGAIPSALAPLIRQIDSLLAGVGEGGTRGR